MSQLVEEEWGGSPSLGVYARESVSDWKQTPGAEAGDDGDLESCTTVQTSFLNPQHGEPQTATLTPTPTADNSPDGIPSVH
ncbi:hypothetical protein Nepgr_023038 [Nepenthes gracilis]|uniref:Uncharacterized protein n=1 Tax=Nepenthes gracilis TaxID=150966 RepID=A0AAD3XYZ8_NEPGR|nr:hypothetical protein Nepgr_023038 [Nepenthes gracilis]